VLATEVANPVIGAELEAAVVAQATAGLALNREELDALQRSFRKIWNLHEDLGDEIGDRVVTALRASGEALLLKRKIREALAVRSVDYRHLSIFLGHLECTQERIVELGRRHPHCGFDLCRLFLNGIGAIAPRIDTDENELMEFVKYIVEDAVEMIEELDRPRDGLRELLGELLDLWAVDEAFTFYFVPDFIVSLKLGKRERKWLREQLDRRLAAPGPVHPEDLEALKARLE
jgi:hypothetical protein